MHENSDLDVDYNSDLFLDQFFLVKKFLYHFTSVPLIIKQIQLVRIPIVLHDEIASVQH